MVCYTHSLCKAFATRLFHIVACHQIRAYIITLFTFLYTNWRYILEISSEIKLSSLEVIFFSLSFFFFAFFLLVSNFSFFWTSDPIHSWWDAAGIRCQRNGGWTYSPTHRSELVCSLNLMTTFCFRRLSGYITCRCLDQNLLLMSCVLALPGNECMKKLWYFPIFFVPLISVLLGVEREKQKTP